MRKFLTFFSKSSVFCGFGFHSYDIGEDGKIARTSTNIIKIYFVIFFLVSVFFAVSFKYSVDLAALLNSELINSIMDIYSTNSLAIYIPMRILNIVLEKNLYDLFNDLQISYNFVSFTIRCSSNCSLNYFHISAHQYRVESVVQLQAYHKVFMDNFHCDNIF